MNDTSDSTMSRAWTRIEAEQRDDRLFRRLTIVGWSVTGTFVLMLVAFGIVQLRFAMKMAVPGMIPFGAMLPTLVPVVLAIGAFCALAATLATIGLFLRMRTAPLQEIQLRLAALEDMLVQTASTRAPK